MVVFCDSKRALSFWFVCKNERSMEVVFDVRWLGGTPCMQSWHCGSEEVGASLFEEKMEVPVNSEVNFID